jgi:DnaJ-class molecular chaperone
MATGCSNCDGTGKVLAYKMIEQCCLNCGGTGTVVMPGAPTRQRGVQSARKLVLGSSGDQEHEEADTCPMCQGRGRAPTRTLVPVHCDVCQGKGQIWSQEHIRWPRTIS